MRGMQKRRCSCCQVRKPLDAFYLNPRYRTGRLAWCKPCHNNRSNGRVPCTHGVNYAPCPVCGQPTKHRGAITCSYTCGETLKRQREALRMAPLLPEHGDGAPVCRTCHDAYRYETDWLGRTLEVCACGVQLMPQKADKSFRRYEGTDERLRVLALGVELQCRPIAKPVPDGTKHELGRAHPWHHSKGLCA